MVRKARLTLGALVLIVAAIALVPVVAHVLAFGFLVVKLMAELAVMVVAASLGFWLLVGALKR